MQCWRRVREKFRTNVNHDRIYDSTNDHDHIYIELGRVAESTFGNGFADPITNPLNAYARLKELQPDLDSLVILSARDPSLGDDVTLAEYRTRVA